MDGKNSRSKNKKLKKLEENKVVFKTQGAKTYDRCRDLCSLSSTLLLLDVLPSIKNNLKIVVKCFGGVNFFIIFVLCLTNKINDMRELICDFSVNGLDNEIEDLTMYDDGNFTEERMTEVINGLIRDHKITVGERCEGTIEMESGVFYVDYRYCSELGEDWDSDVWEDEMVDVTVL